MNRLNFILLLVYTGVFYGCSSHSSVTERGNGSSYVSYTGSEVVREQIKESFNSVRRLQSNVVYRNYYFDVDQLPTKSELQTAQLRDIATDTFIDDHSNAGTAIVISKNRTGPVLLTASHVVSYPDTIWHYRTSANTGPDAPIEGISIRQSVSHYIIEGESLISFEIAANDPRRDIAILTANISRSVPTEIPALMIEPGSASSLDWTDLVYVVGYPRGIQMVTSAMVSNFQISPRRSFILDSSFNRGFSGGAVFSVKQDGSGLEWVGILSAAYAETEFYLSPPDSEQIDDNINREYTGPLVLRRAARVNYGITYGVGIDEIEGFFDDSAEILNRLGIEHPAFSD